MDANRIQRGRLVEIDYSGLEKRVAILLSELSSEDTVRRLKRLDVFRNKLLNYVSDRELKRLQSIERTLFDTEQLQQRIVRKLFKVYYQRILRQTFKKNFYSKTELDPFSQDGFGHMWS